MSDDWAEVVPEGDKEAPVSEGKTRGQDVESNIDILRSAMNEVYLGHFDYSKADRIAALALTVQIELAKFAADAEWRARQAKAEIKHISAEANYRYRTSADKKISEAALEQLVNKDPDVKNAELKMAEYERDAKRWQNYYNTLKDAHIFFRSLNNLAKS
ncbi:MAG TPA: hypothetical protein VM577_06105 [Anaerovoracaceae bacterium]|nr:hypothetical protein [Anaerovoracaceae bacterium]